MPIWMYSDGKGLFPADLDAKERFAKLGAGEVAQVNIVRPRSLQWHRMYFAICNAIGQNQDPPRDEDSIDHELRIRAGHYKAGITFSEHRSKPIFVRVRVALESFRNQSRHCSKRWV